MAKPIPRQYRSAFKQGHRVSAREYIDDELAHLLWERGDPKSLETLEWIAKFNNEYYGAFLKEKEGMHDKKHHKGINDRANARRRDLMMVAKYGVVSIEDTDPNCLDPHRIAGQLEDLLIELIDREKGLDACQNQQK